MIKPQQTIVRVGIADLNVARGPSIIRTSGLGSCVGVVIYDLQRSVAGIAHIMLPDSHFGKKADMNPYKYADTAIETLVVRLVEHGASAAALKAKIAGGAQMFHNASSSQMMRIGIRNTEAARENLYQYNIPIVSEAIGGNSGRTIEFNPQTGQLHIRTVNKGETII